MILLCTQWMEYNAVSFCDWQLVRIAYLMDCKSKTILTTLSMSLHLHDFFDDQYLST